MAVDAYIDEPFIFQTLFVDPAGAPVLVLSPNITIFRMDPLTGDEIPFVVAAPMSPVFPPEPGRFVFPYVIPATLLDGDVLYAETRATDPVTLYVSVSSEVLNVKSRASDPAACPGLNARFVK
jgi:hypothetical protein